MNKRSGLCRTIAPKHPEPGDPDYAKWLEGPSQEAMHARQREGHMEMAELDGFTREQASDGIGSAVFLGIMLARMGYPLSFIDDHAAIRKALDDGSLAERFEEVRAEIEAKGGGKFQLKAEAARR